MGASLSPHDETAWAGLRAQFHRPAGQIYLDGNSLGLLSHPAEAALLRAIARWGAAGIGGWLEAEPAWLTLAETLASGVAPMLGVNAPDITLTGQTTPNLHQLLATLFDPAHATRRVILGDVLNFASDGYALASHLRLRGLDPSRHLRRVASRDGFTLRAEDIIAAIETDVQLVVLPSVLFTSGQLLDVRRISMAARERGAMVGWDLSHSIGAVPHALMDAGADCAFWCSYKYLNGGPGAVGGLWLHPRHAERPPGLAGWWGVRPDRRFAMAPEHEPAAGAARLQVGTPTILGLAPLEGTLELFAAAGGIDAVRARSLHLTQHVINRVESDLAPLGVSIVTPREAAERGGHVALAHPEAWRLCQAWKAAGVVPDFRHPAVLRVAPVAFYTSPGEIDEALDRLTQILRDGSYRAYPDQPNLVP